MVRGDNAMTTDDPGQYGPLWAPVTGDEVRDTVTVKYKASVRVSGWVKAAAEARSIRKYVEANSSRKRGTIKPSASTACAPG